MAYSFSSELVTGNITIDDQHKKLFDAINKFLDACSNQVGRDELSNTMKFLYDYTTKHFSDEEGLQRKTNYPQYMQHRQYHEEFKKTVKELADVLEANGPSIALIAKFNNIISGWLINHIKREDLKVAEHIRSA